MMRPSRSGGSDASSASKVGATTSVRTPPLKRKSIAARALLFLAGVALLLVGVVAFWWLAWSVEWSEAEKKLPLASGSELLDSLAVMASGLARAMLVMVIGVAAAVALVASTSASTLAALVLALIFGAWALVSCAAAFTLFALTWDRLGGGSTVCFIFVVVGMTVLIAATAKAVLMRVGAPFVGFAAMAVLQENVEFSAAHFGWLATSGLVFGGYILGTAALVYRPRRSIVTHSKITSECIRIVLYGYTLTWLDDAPRVLLTLTAISFYYMSWLCSTTRRTCGTVPVAVCVEIISGAPRHRRDVVS